MRKDNALARAEHEVIRNKVGYYDFTHKLLEVAGKDASAFLDRMMVGPIGKSKVGTAKYTTMLNEKGIIIDDVIVFRIAEEVFWVSTLYIEELIAWFDAHRVNESVSYREITGNTTMYAVQGPNAPDVLNAMMDKPVDDLKHFQIADNSFDCICVKVANSGYTGEKGYEIYCHPNDASKVENKLERCGERYGIRKITTDVIVTSLPREKGYVLMSDLAGTNPYEVGFDWTVDWSKQFIGKEALTRVRDAGAARALLGFMVDDPAAEVAVGSDVRYGSKIVGKVTTYTYGFTVEKNIGFALVDTSVADVGDVVTVGDDISVKLTDRVFYDPQNLRTKITTSSSASSAANINAVRSNDFAIEGEYGQILNEYLEKMNREGRQKLLERAMELVELSKYQLNPGATMEGAAGLAYRKLNAEGRKRAAEWLGELTEIPRYRALDTSDAGPIPDRAVLSGEELRRVEHETVRERVGYYDFTHKLLEVKGPDSADFLDRLFVSAIGKAKVGVAKYTTMLNEKGEIIDDVIVFRIAKDTYWVSTLFIDELIAWFNAHHAGEDVRWKEITNETTMYAVQGPRSRDVLNAMLEKPVTSLKHFQIEENSVANIPVRIANSGYTGELGYEIYCHPKNAARIEEELEKSGKRYGIRKITTDVIVTSLPREKGYVLMSDLAGTNPLEVGFDWTVGWNKYFVGKEALARVRQNGAAKELLGFQIKDPSKKIEVGAPVKVGSETIGRVTMYTYGFTVGTNIGFALVDRKKAGVGTKVTVGGVDTTLTERIFYDPKNLRQAV